MTEQVQSELGFADSELEGYQRSASELVVRVRCWNETLATVTFRDVLAVRDVMAGSFSAFVHQEDKSIEFLRQVIATDRGESLLSHGYQVFSFLKLAALGGAAREGFITADLGYYMPRAARSGKLRES